MLKRYVSVLLILFLASVTALQAQDKKLVVIADHQPAGAFFVDLSLQSDINIIYSDNQIETLPPVTLTMKNVTVEEILSEVLKNSNIGYRYIGNQIVLYQLAESQLRYTISGLVMDSLSSEPLISAYVFEERSGKSTLTNEYGYFSLNLPAGEISLVLGYSGYYQQRMNIALHRDQIIQVNLEGRAMLKEIVVQENYEKDIDKVKPREVITLADLQNNIQLGGASDLYRVADFVPGVHTGTDGVGGIHVRGGANDQNLILMDGVPIYHPNHLLGIISVFNYQIIQQATIYKANFPSKFSGRLSSVIDVRTREGNINHWGFSGNVGLSEFGLMAEGPLVPGKVGLLLTGRFFLPGLFMKDLTSNYKVQHGLQGFSDIDYLDFNGKINWKIGLRDRLYFSVYRGDDMFSDFTIRNLDQIDRQTGIRIVTEEEFDKRLNWANKTGVFRWNHILSDQVFANLILSTSSFVLQSVDKSSFDFRFPDDGLAPIVGFDTKEFKSGIRDVTGRLELDIRPSADHKLNAGIYGIRYLFQPKSISHNEESKVGDFYLEEGLIDDDLFTGFKVHAFEAGIYGEDSWTIKEGFNLTSGIHISSFFVQNTYYLDPQLRVNLAYQPIPSYALSVGYSRMAQYLHNLTSSSIGLPTDLWVPTTSEVAPALSDQYTISALWNPNKLFSIDISAYIKDMRSVISYQEGASFLLPEGPIASIVDAGNWEKKITTGDGNASGVELQFTYDHRKLNFKWNGTWSRSFRRFDEINSGNPFPDRFDRRWSTTLTGQFRWTPKFSIGMNFIYGTGIAITLAESKFTNPGFIFPALGINYSERNGYRLPPYNRLDLIFNYVLGETESFSHSLSLNLYNVYNRTNPFYITLVQEPVNQVLEFRQFSLFRFFPSLTYRFSL